MYINDNKIHGFQHTHDSVQSRHHLVQGTVGHLPPSDHDRAPSNRTMGYSVLKTLNGKSHPLVHEVVQVYGVTRHFRHHNYQSVNNKNRPQSMVQSFTKKHVSTALTYG